MHQFLRVALTKSHKLSGLKQQTCILSQFWRLEVQDRGVSQAMLPWRALGENPFWPLRLVVAVGDPWLVDASLRSRTSHHILVRTLAIGLGPTLIQYDLIFTG